MKFRERLYRAAERMEMNQRAKSYKTNERRTLTEDDMFLYDVAVRQRRRPIGSQDEIIKYLNSKNPVRLRRMRADYRWCQKQYKRLGLNPEDVVNLL